VNWQKEALEFLAKISFQFSHEFCIYEFRNQEAQGRFRDFGRGTSDIEIDCGSDDGPDDDGEKYILIANAH